MQTCNTGYTTFFFQKMVCCWDFVLPNNFGDIFKNQGPILQMMGPGHYEAFRYLVRNGSFDGLSPESYFKDIVERAHHFVSPLIDDQVAETLGISPQLLKKKFQIAMDTRPNNGKLLDLAQIVCIEDSKSAVFIENHPTDENTVNIVSYFLSENGYSSGVVIYGDVRLVHIDSEGTRHLIARDIHGTYVVNGRATLSSENGTNLDAINRDFFTHAVTAIEHILYMEEQGMLEGVRRIS